MQLNDMLEIIIVTYNRKEKIFSTLQQLLAESSPVKSLKITVLNNCSTDGTDKVIDTFSAKYNNIHHVIQPRNIGGCANIAYAYEIAKMPYVWVICDDDDFNWNHWDEIENAIYDGYDAVFTQHKSNLGVQLHNSLADVFYASTFVPACIYKTSHLTYTTVFNMYESCSILFSHSPIIAKIINEDGKIFLPQKAQLVSAGKDFTSNYKRYLRGLDEKYIPVDRIYLYWTPAYFSAISLIKNRKKQIEIIDGLRHGANSLFDFFKAKIYVNKIFYNNYFNNYYKIFRMLSFKQKIIFIYAYMATIGRLWGLDTRLLKLSEKSKWGAFFRYVKQQKYIDKLAKKYKGKKLLIYGAGLVFQCLVERYDLSNLDIVAVCDKKFKEETTVNNLRAIPVELLEKEKFDVVFMSLKYADGIASDIKKAGLKFKYEVIYNNKISFFHKLSL
ncbi:MAG: glycosyltransferase family 2 protein [Candidatus Gastranaerophilales bacterium]|nr:glycosyltransferase family 2 protein [Candidatus Gastranaerophilales bacterium]